MKVKVKSLSRVQLCNPMVPQQAPLSLGFSRQEHWSGLPFPSPMHESESEVAQSCLTLSDPMAVAHQAPLSMELSRQEHWSVLPFPSPGDLSDPGIESGLPHCRHILYCLNHQGKWIYDGLLSLSNIFVPWEL